MDMADCVLTLDYELFFQESGDAQVSVLKPTRDLLVVLQKIGGKAVFFVDTVYLNLLKSSKVPGDLGLYKEFENQLEEIVSQGHRIELHLHPHWLDVRRGNNDEWLFESYEHYKLNSLAEEKILCLFKEGVDLLNEIARRINPEYAVSAFRAGGWCVEPFEKLSRAFKECGIGIDSSVVPGMKLDGKIHGLDYSGLQPRAFYRFSQDVRIPDAQGEFWEIPVNGYYLSFWGKLKIALGRKLNRKRAEIFGNGMGIRIIAASSPIKRMWDLVRLKKYYNQFSLDGYVNKRILERKISKANLSFVSIVAHPKTLTLSSLEAIEYLAFRGYHFIDFATALKKK